MPNGFNTLMTHAQMLLRSGRLAEADTAGQKLIELAPGNIDAWILWVLCAKLSENWDASYQRALKLITLAPQAWDSWYLRGLSEYALGRPHQGSECFSRAEALLPEGVDCIVRTACALGADPSLRTKSVSTASLADVLAEQTVPRVARLNRRAMLDEIYTLLPHEYRLQTFDALWLPLIEELLGRQEHWMALAIHQFGMGRVATLPHTAERWRTYFDRVNPVFADAGAAAGKRLLPQTRRSDRYRVAFVQDFASSVGSGLQMLLSILNAFCLIPRLDRGIEPVVLAFEESSGELHAACKGLDIELINLNVLRGCSYDEDTLIERVQLARTMLSERDITAAIFFSTHEGWVSLISSMGLAAVQLYWTMGFHSINAPCLDARLACASLTACRKSINGLEWLSGPFPFPNPFPALGTPDYALLSGEAQRIRNELGDNRAVILGTLARTEKIIDPEFVAALTRILAANPKAVYLWFGVTRDVPALASLFNHFGIAERCHFMGWVDTKVYAQVLDVHLDPFGLPTGLTMMETFWSGSAYVIRRSTESSHIGIAAALAEIADTMQNDSSSIDSTTNLAHPETGESLVMLADSTDEYVSMAIRLAADGVFRSKVGGAARKLMERHYANPQRMASIFTKHILDAINSKLRPN
jgi:hypothetical protein